MTRHGKQCEKRDGTILELKSINLNLQNRLKQHKTKHTPHTHIFSIVTNYYTRGLQDNVLGWNIVPASSSSFVCLFVVVVVVVVFFFF